MTLYDSPFLKDHVESKMYQRESESHPEKALGESLFAEFSIVVDLCKAATKKINTISIHDYRMLHNN